MRTILLAVFAGTLTVLSGCAGLPEKEAAAFAVLASTSQAAFEGAATAEESAVRDLATTRVAKLTGEISESGGCTTGIADAQAECHLIFTSTKNDLTKSELSVPFRPTAPTMRVLASRLGQYGKAMEELAKAEDIAAVKAAAGEAAGSVKALLNLVPKIGAVVGPIVDFAKWAYGIQLIEERRGKLLALAEGAHPLVATAGKYMGDIIDAYRSNIVAAESQRLSDLSMALKQKRKGKLVVTGEKERKALVDAMFESAKRIDAANNMPTDFSALEKGHAKLLEALRNPDVDVGVAVAQLREFVEHLKAVEAALKK